MKKKTVIIFILTSILFSTGISTAWDETGHKLIGRIAYQYLTPQAREKLDTILASSEIFQLESPPETTTTHKTPQNLQFQRLDKAAVWPDYRDELPPCYLQWKHYINTPLDIRSDKTELPPHPNFDVISNLYESFSYIVISLKTNNYRNQKTAEMMSFLIHLTGDIHCPMHTITLFSDTHPLGDKGGNLTTVRGKDGEINLHAYWDTVPTRIMKETNLTLEQLAEEIIKTHPRDSFTKELETKDFRTWTEQLYTIGGLPAYEGISHDKTTLLTEEYENRAEKHTLKVIALAGYRLADILNLLLNENKDSRTKLNYSFHHPSLSQLFLKEFQQYERIAR